ncbi:hypothetical protein MRX96_036608 [Rhipicephalus microplus]
MDVEPSTRGDDDPALISVYRREPAGGCNLLQCSGIQGAGGDAILLAGSLWRACGAFLVGSNPARCISFFGCQFSIQHGFRHDGRAAVGTPVPHELSLSRQQDTLDDVTDSENLCDLVGTMVAYAAYSSLPENFKSETLAGLNASSEQLFFISHCLKWCAQLSKPPRRYAPFRSRCIVPLMNMPEFSSAFNCAPGSPMNPQNKCTFW